MVKFPAVPSWSNHKPAGPSYHFLLGGNTLYSVVQELLLILMPTSVFCYYGPFVASALLIPQKHVGLKALPHAGPQVQVCCQEQCFITFHGCYFLFVISKKKRENVPGCLACTWPLQIVVQGVSEKSVNSTCLISLAQWERSASASATHRVMRRSRCLCGESCPRGPCPLMVATSVKSTSESILWACLCRFEPHLYWSGTGSYFSIIWTPSLQTDCTRGMPLLQTFNVRKKWPCCLSKQKSRGEGGLIFSALTAAWIKYLLHAQEMGITAEVPCLMYQMYQIYIS